MTLREQLYRHRFFTLFVIICVFVNAIIIYYFYREYRLTLLYQEEVDQAFLVHQRTHQLLLPLQDMQIGRQGFLLSKDEAYLSFYKRAFSVFTEELQELWSSIARIPSHQLILRTIKGQIDVLEGSTKSAKIVISAQNLQEEKILFNRLQGLLYRLLALENDLLKTQRKALDAQQRKLGISSILVAAVSEAALLSIALVLYTLNERDPSHQRKLEESESRLAESEYQLAQQEKSLAVTLQTLNDGVFDWNLKTGHVFYSPRWLALLGYTSEEFPPHLESFNRCLHPDDHEAVWERFEQYQKKQVAKYHNYYRIRHKDGHYVWQIARGVGAWEGDDLVHLVGSVTDITEQKENEEYLRQINKELENMVYIAFHDLRSPLVNLKGFASELAYSLEEMAPLVQKYTAHFTDEDREKWKRILEADIPESIHYINNSAAKMDALTASILDLSRIGQRQVQQERIDTRQIAQRCIDALGHDIHQKEAEIKLEALPAVTSDPLLLEQIFGNILDNAVKYLSPERPGRIIVRGRQEGSYAIFEIEDNGRGISDQDTEKIFQFFRRARNSRDVRGQGMGMAYVKAMVKKLGGRIWFHSSLDQGTIFYFTIPLH